MNKLLDIDSLARMTIHSLQNIEHPTPELIRTLVKGLGAPVGITTDEELESVAKIVETKLSIWLELGNVIKSDDKHDETWFKRISDENWEYWQDYKNHLYYDLSLGQKVISTLGEETLRTMGLLADPSSPGPWSRRGMVVGHVQSGKTANYLGLVSRAADAGYRVIIIIAGIHNNLRSQTQRRTDEGFIGRKSNNLSEMVGVGASNPSRNSPISLTTTETDFTVKTANNLMPVAALKTPLVLVVKKNASVLKRLHKWLKDLNANKHSGQVMEYPLLVIDDEADNASINTNDPDLSPTRINSQIRAILSLFSKNCYVGYTATPFANIFIDPEATADAIDKDIFPRDFIHCLEAPTNYVGAKRLFGQGDLSKNVIDIKDIEEIIPPSHKKSIIVSDLPPSLKKALGVFILARAVRLARGHGNKHCSMLVNISPYQDVQKQVKDLLLAELDNLKNAIRYSYARPEEALKRPEISELKDIFDELYAESGTSWDDVIALLNESASPIVVRAINSGSSDVLDYQAYEERKEALNVIAVGGYALSRGLTLEGLMISYISRSTKLYDTLLQMGRWFGYRPDYTDLCRIWMRPAMRRWYSHIAFALEELRQQVMQMERDKRTPRDFALYVRTSQEDSLLITAANKMKHTEKFVVTVDYAGLLKETDILTLRKEVTLSNRNLIQTIHNKLKAFSAKATPDGDSTWRGCDVWRKVPAEIVTNFIEDFRVHPAFLAKKRILQTYLSKLENSECDVVFIKLAQDANASTAKSLDQDMPYLSKQRRTAGDEISSPEIGYKVGGNNRVAGTGDERIGLSFEEMENAKQLYYERSKTDSGKPADIDYRNARDRPLLMIHLVDMLDEQGDLLTDGDGLPAYSMSFSGKRKYRKPVEYIFNRTLVDEQLDWLQDGLEVEEEADGDRDTNPLG